MNNIYYLRTGNMSYLQHIMETIRPVLVGVKGWNYCVFWKLTEDQRYLELMDCCCGGSESKVNNNNGGSEEEELLFTVMSVNNNPCRDVMIQHPTTKPCHLLSQLPSSIPMDSPGIHAQTLISNHPRWLNFSNSCSLDIEETIETRVFVPVSLGLVELFVDKQVPEDQRLIDFIISQFNVSPDQQSIINSSFSFKPNSVITENDQNVQKEIFQPPVSPATMIQNLNLQDDITSDQIHLHNSQMIFFQQFEDHIIENGNKNLLDSSNEQDHRPLNAFNSSTEGYDQEDVDAFQKSMLINNASTSANAQMINSPVEPGLKSKKRQNDDRDSMNRSDSVSDCSDPNDDEDNNDGKYKRRNGKGGAQCKNLEAERKRRKKLNERLYNLRSLVPKITKLDRASILGDAIEYVMELKQQVTDLQNELERNVEDDDGPNDNQSTLQSEVVHGSEIKIGSKSEQGKTYNRTHMGVPSSIGTEVPNMKNQNTESTTDHKVQQMEPQVEVIQLDGNELFVKVFCEHKPGGFVKLMEAFNSLGLEVTNVNVTSLLSLVLNVFKVERKDCEMIQADHVRESLLELTRNPTRSWSEMNKASPENGIDHNNYHNYHHHQHPTRFQQNHHLHHLHN